MGRRLTPVVSNYVSGQPATVSQNVRLTYGYNPAGELTSYCPPVSVGAGNCLTAFWAYGRDGFGNVSSQAAPAGSSLGAISASYDPLGRLVRRPGQLGQPVPVPGPPGPVS